MLTHVGSADPPEEHRDGSDAVATSASSLARDLLWTMRIVDKVPAASGAMMNVALRCDKREPAPQPSSGV
jgi:hypothetical protein